MTTKKMLWAGYVVSALPVAVFVFSAVMKFSKAEEPMKGYLELGWSPNAAVCLGITELVCTLIYVIPRTTILGAILLTGYMGGAIATHARIGQAFYLQILIGVLVRLGPFLRDSRLRALIPWRR